jgi:hypothetical protein
MIQDPYSEVFINVNPIKIMVKFNTKEGEHVPFDYDMIDHPQKKMVKNVDSKMPYFTNSVKYPYDLLYNKDYVYILEFFFSKKKFEKVLLKNITDYVDENEIYTKDVVSSAELIDDNVDIETQGLMETVRNNGEHNIDVMLKLLFPIKYTFDNVYSSTYRQNILEEFNTNVFSFDIKRPFWEGNEGIIKSDGTPHIVTNVIWQNDLLNHPIYYDFLEKYNKSMKSRRGFSNKMKFTYNEKLIEFVVILFQLYNVQKYTDITNTNNQLNYFEKLNEELEREKPPQNVKNILSNTQANKAQAIDKMLTELNYFLVDKTINPNAKSNTQMFLDNVIIVTKNSKGDTTEQVSKRQVLETLQLSEQHVTIPLEHIMRMYNDYYEYNRGESRINIESKVYGNLVRAYNACIAIKSVKLIRDFLLGDIRKLDLSEKNKDNTEKTKEERDIISYINTNYAQYAKMSDEISDSISSVVPPIRETSNYKLRSELNKIRFNQGNKIELGNVYDCTKSSDVFRDVYYKYILGMGHSQFDTNILYTGVNTLGGSNSSDSKKDSMHEIYIIIDLVNKSYYDSKKARCRLHDDVLNNELNHLLQTKMENIINPFRSYDIYNESFVGVNNNEKPNNTSPQTDSLTTGELPETARGGSKSILYSRRPKIKNTKSINYNIACVKRKRRKTCKKIRVSNGKTRKNM